jgi:hypothetical protein
VGSLHNLVKAIHVLVNGVRLLALYTTCRHLHACVIRTLHSQPNRMYNASDSRLLRRRLFPCPGCGLAADGSHQCQECFRHIHQLDDCSLPVLLAEEGAGMPRLCFSFGKKLPSFLQSCLHYNPPQLTTTCSQHKIKCQLTEETFSVSNMSTNYDKVSPTTIEAHPVIDMQSPGRTNNPPLPLLEGEERLGGWLVSPCPDSITVHLDVVDRNQITA